MHRGHDDRSHNLFRCFFFKWESGLSETDLNFRLVEWCIFAAAAINQNSYWFCQRSSSTSLSASQIFTSLKLAICNVEWLGKGKRGKSRWFS